MDIARLLNCDESNDADRRHPHMDVARLLNDDDSDQNDHKPLVGAAYSPATPPPGSIALAPPQWSGAPAASHQESATPVTPQKEQETPTSLSKKSKAAAAPIPERAVTPANPSIRAVARARPSRPRKPSIKSLRAQVEAFEFVVKHLPYVLRDLDDDSSTTSTANATDLDEDDPTKSGDHDVQRMCSFLKRTVVLSRQAQEEIAMRTEYLRLLKHHYEGTANLHKLMRGVRLDYWFWMCERWRSLTHDYYEPLLEVRAYEIVQETVQAIKNHKLPDGMKESDAFGWQDWVHLDADQRYVRFMTRKTLHTDLEQLVGLAWSIYSDGDLYKMYHTGDRCELFLQVVQQISPDVMVLQSVEKYPELEQLTHSLSLVFRVQTETGYMIAVRAIESPQLLSLMKAEGISLSGNFFWDTFEVATRDGCDAVQYTLAGSIGSDNPTYARRARDEILIALVRAESRIGDPSIVAIEMSTVEDTTEVSPVTNESQAIL